DRLKTHLQFLQKMEPPISIWDYRVDISPGQDWFQQIEIHLDKANLILLLVSLYFFVSDDYEEIIWRVMDKYDRGEAWIVPVILRPVEYEGTPISRLQVLPTGGVPVTDRKW